MSGVNLGLNEKSPWNIVQAILQLAQGRSNSVGQVTLRANQSTTTVTKAVDKAAVNMSLNAAVFLSPITANAQAISYSWWISAKGQGTFTITHANTPEVDQTFDFEIRGG
jgi:hypothetical protein